MHTILAALDFSDVTDPLLDQARLLAKKLGSRLYLVHVADPDPYFVGDAIGPKDVRNEVAHRYREEHQRLAELVDALHTHEIDSHALLIGGPAADKIVKEAERLEADLILVGSHRRGSLRKSLLGSVSEGILQQAPCPVLIVPAPETS